MKFEKKVVMLVFFAFMLISSSVLTFAIEGSYENSVREDIFLVRPDSEYIDAEVFPQVYLSDEDLIYYTCVEYDDVDVRTSVLCRDDNAFKDLQAVRWGNDNCYITSVDLSEFEDCTRMTLQSDYIKDDENIKLQKDITINKHTESLGRIVTTQYSDGGWESPLDTAHAILALAQYPDVFEQEIVRAEEYLKLQRNEEEKCWPKDDCKLSTTANIVALLSQSGLDDTYRIVHDGQAYLRSKLFKIENNEKWTVNIQDHPNNLDDGVPTECVYDFNGKNTTFNITDNNYTILTISPAYEDYINFVCTENVEISFFDGDMKEFLFYEGDNMTYEVPGSCLTFNNENVNCDYRSTAFYLMTEISEDSDRKRIDNYLEDHLVDYELGGKYLHEQNTMNSALYAHSTEKSDSQDDLVTYLQLTQWNDGYWNDSDFYYNDSWYEYDREELMYLPHVIYDNVSVTIIRTAYNILGLLGTGMERSDEPIKDAMRWISVHEGDYSLNISDDDLTDEEIAKEYWINVTEILNDTKRNAMTFYALNKYARPMIKATPKIVIMNNASAEIKLVNPTVFTYEHLEYSFSPALAKYLNVEEKEYLGPYGFRVVTVSQKDGSSPDVFGYLTIKNSGNEIAKIPILITSYPEITIDNQKSITVFGTRSKFSLNVQKSPHQFDCTLSWVQPDIKSQEKFTVVESGAMDIDLTFTRAETIEKVYEGVFSCKTGSTVIENKFSLLTNKFSSRPIDVTPSSIYINETDQDGYILVKNLLDQTIDVFITAQKEDPYFELDKTMLTLYPGEVANITILNTVTSGMNYSSFNTYNIKTFSLEEQVMFVSEIVAVPPATRPIFLLVMYFVIALSLLGAGGYYAYENRQKIIDWYNKNLHKESQRAKVVKEVMEYEQKERSLAILNMMQILRLRKVSESDIRKQLQGNGFSEEDINNALRMQAQAETQAAEAKRAPPKNKE